MTEARRRFAQMMQQMQQKQAQDRMRSQMGESRGPRPVTRSGQMLGALRMANGGSVRSPLPSLQEMSDPNYAGQTRLNTDSPFSSMGMVPSFNVPGANFGGGATYDWTAPSVQGGSVTLNKGLSFEEYEALRQADLANLLPGGGGGGVATPTPEPEPAPQPVPQPQPQPQPEPQPQPQPQPQPEPQPTYVAPAPAPSPDPLAAINDFWSMPADPPMTPQEQAQANPITAIDQFWNPPQELAPSVAQDPRYNIVADAYRTYLGKEPDPDGISWWLGKDLSGQEIADVISQMPEAIEYMYGNQPGTWSGGNQN